MHKLIIKRILESIPVLWVIMTVTFIMTRGIPGDPFINEKISPEALEQKRIHFGLNKPMLDQYVDTFSQLFSGKLLSFKHPGWTVNEIISDRLFVSIELGLWALLVAVGLGLTTGLVASLRPNSKLDHIPMAIAMTGICLPTFVMGPIWLLIFCLKLEWLPVWGWDLPQNRILPAMVLGMYYAAYIARIARTSLIEVRNMDYIRTARAKGLTEISIQWIHALRNALPPVISFLGPAAAGLVSGSFVVETIFKIPGLGQMFVESAINQSNNLLLGLVTFYAILIVGFNLVVDIALCIVNPRIKIDS